MIANHIMAVGGSVRVPGGGGGAGQVSVIACPRTQLCFRRFLWGQGNFVVRAALIFSVSVSKSKAVRLDECARTQHGIT